MFKNNDKLNTMTEISWALNHLGEKVQVRKLKKPVKLLVHKWLKICFVFVWLPANKFEKNQFFDFRSCTKDGFFVKRPHDLFVIETPSENSRIVTHNPNPKARSNDGYLYSFRKKVNRSGTEVSTIK